MSDEAGNPITPAPTLTPEEQASVEAGQRGFTEPTNVLAPVSNEPARPEYIPEKFWKDGKADYEALAKSYTELEKAKSAPKVDEPKTEETPAVAPDGKLEKPKPVEGEATPLTAGIEKARTEYAEKGEVTEETVAALEAAGIPKEVFSLYLEGIKAVERQALETIHGFVDGAENYAAMSQWAVEKLTDAELDAFNTALDDPALRENAVRGLFARYSTARPSEGNLLTPAGAPSQGGDVYTARDQLIADQKNPLYQTDAGFRQQVVDKLARSQKTGFSVVEKPMFERDILSR